MNTASRLNQTMRGESKRGAKRPRDVNMDVIWGLGVGVAVRCRSPAPGRERFRIGVELGTPGGATGTAWCWESWQHLL